MPCRTTGASSTGPIWISSASTSRKGTGTLPICSIISPSTPTAIRFPEIICATSGILTTVAGNGNGGYSGDGGSATNARLNPIRPGQFKKTDIQKKCDYLINYPWSSYPGYCYLRKRDKHIDYGWLLNTYFGEDTAQGRRRYRAYVQQGIEGEIENPFEEVLHQSILGSQSFVKWVKKKLPGDKQREIPSLRNCSMIYPLNTS